MKRTALNPLQDSLITADNESLAPFGVPTDGDAHETPGSRALVEEIMRDGRWRTLPQIAAELKSEYGVRSMETAISARVRDLRHKGYLVQCERSRPGSNLYQYRAIHLATRTVATNGQVVEL